MFVIVSLLCCAECHRQEVPRSIQPVGYQAGWIIALQSAGTIYIIIKETKCLGSILPIRHAALIPLLSSPHLSLLRLFLLSPLLSARSVR